MEREEADRRVGLICLVVIATVAAGAALHWLRPVMIPFVLAMLLAYGLTPLVDLLVRRLRAPRTPAIFGAILLGFLAFTLVAGLVTSSVRRLGKDADVYAARLTDLVERASATLSGWGLDVGAESLRAQLAGADFGPLLVQATDALVGTLSTSFLVLVFVIYLLLGHDGAPSGGIRGDIEQRIRRYITLKTLLSAATGVLTGLILAALGVKLAMVFGVLAFVLNFIPSVGSIVAVLLPLPVVLFDPAATGLTVALVLLLPGAVQMGIGNVLEPKLMGESLELHPITVLLALILWGMLWGVPGMVLATPITAVLKILMGQLELTRPVADLMAGKVGGQSN